MMCEIVIAQVYIYRSHECIATSQSKCGHMTCLFHHLRRMIKRTRAMDMLFTWRWREIENVIIFLYFHDTKSERFKVFRIEDV